MSERTEQNPDKKRNLSEIMDLSGEKRLAGFVARYEQLLRDADAIKADVTELKNEMKEGMLLPTEIKAVAQIAKLRKDDKAGAAEEQLAALRRVSRACGIDLFRWADAEQGQE